MLANAYLLPPANEVYEGYVFTRVCYSVQGGGGGVPPDQVHPRDQVPPTGTPPQDQVHPPGTKHTPRDQVHPPGPGTPPGTRYTPRAVHAGIYGQQAGGTHPTGMHSCCFKK